jgi:pilus assembly protein Flp/PilA
MTFSRFIAIVQIAIGDLADRVRHQDNERGATAVEYGLLVALIAGVIIGVVTLLGTQLKSVFSGVTALLPGG